MISTCVLVFVGNWTAQPASVWDIDPPKSQAQSFEEVQRLEMERQRRVGISLQRLCPKMEIFTQISPSNGESRLVQSLFDICLKREVEEQELQRRKEEDMMKQQEEMRRREEDDRRKAEIERQKEMKRQEQLRVRERQKCFLSLNLSVQAANACRGAETKILLATRAKDGQMFSQMAGIYRLEHLNF